MSYEEPRVPKAQNFREGKGREPLNLPSVHVHWGSTREGSGPCCASRSPFVLTVPASYKQGQLGSGASVG